MSTIWDSPAHAGIQNRFGFGPLALPKSFTETPRNHDRNDTLPLTESPTILRNMLILTCQRYVRRTIPFLGSKVSRLGRYGAARARFERNIRMIRTCSEPDRLVSQKRASSPVRFTGMAFATTCMRTNNIRPSEPTQDFCPGSPTCRSR